MCNSVGDRLITETNALGKTRSFTYDPAGNRTGITDRYGKTRRFSFDPLNCLTTETWTGDGRTINSSYDAAGQLTQINDAGAAYNYGYDPDGRLLSVNNAGTAGSPSVLMSYDYDAAGNMLLAADSINGSPGGTNTYTFDPLNRVIQMQQNGIAIQSRTLLCPLYGQGQIASACCFEIRSWIAIKRSWSAISTGFIQEYHQSDRGIFSATPQLLL